MKESDIAAKERWAQKLAGNARPAMRSVNRLPPGQRQVHNSPGLDLGVQPEVALVSWELKIGAPARVISPKRYAWKGAKFIRESTFMDRAILGFWEVRGFSNTADSCSADRFAMAASPPPGFQREPAIY